MPYLPLDDRFPSNPKVARLSDRAFRLHVVALCYCATHLTDGFVSVSANLWGELGSNIRRTAELVSAGLWGEVEGGFLIHDYLDWNASAAQIKEKRRRDRARKRANVFGDSARNPAGNPKSFRAESSGTASKEVLKEELRSSTNTGIAPAVVAVVAVKPDRPVDKRRRYDELLDAARRFAADWKGGTSDAFDAGLDELERLTSCRLQAGDRYRLWEQAWSMAGTGL